MRTILVTGGAGFVGSHACKALAGAGYSPVTFDNLERGHDWAVKWGRLNAVTCETKRFFVTCSGPGNLGGLCTCEEAWRRR
jgi:UDP-glucose 4-epimerase